MAVNIIINFGDLSLDFLVLMADIFYSDYNSMAVWIGDVFYLIAG